MMWTVLCCVTLASCLAVHAESVASSPQENRSLHPDPAALFSSGRPQRLGEFLLLKDFMNQGDSLLKERLEETYRNLKEQFKEGDSVLKTQIVEGVAQVKEQLKEGDGRLKEELNEDVAWLKDKLAKTQTRMKEELAEEEAQMKEELAEQRDAFENLRNSVKQPLSSAVIDDLRQQVVDVQAQLKTTQLQQQTTQTELTATQDSLQSIQTDFHNSQEKVQKAQDELQTTREQLQHEVEASAALKTQLQVAQEAIDSLKVNVNVLDTKLQDSLLKSSNMEEPDNFAIGSTFIRWGNKICPRNTFLVYSGVVGGSHYNHPGGASNYLCLVMHPQLDNMTEPSRVYVNYLYGTEYDHMAGHHDLDNVCSVCRAPQATTLMIPATFTCPVGWTTQYTGHLVSQKYDHKGRSEYVCLDQAQEHRDGSEADKQGALFVHVVSKCGSLPCPPYADNEVVTCVVCSM